MILNINDVKIYKQGPATSFGWLKRAELGTASIDVWEAPTGEQVVVPRGYMPEIAMFTPPPGFMAENPTDYVPR